MGLCLVACEARGTEGLTTLARSLVSPDFWGCHVPVDPGHRMGPLRRRDRESVQRTPLVARAAAKTPSRLSDGRYQEERARPGVILHAPPCPIAEKPNVEF